MADHRFGESDGCSKSNQKNLAYGIHGIPTSQAATNFISGQDETAFFEDLMEDIPFSAQGKTKLAFVASRPPPTLEIFPSWPVDYQKPHTSGQGNSMSEDSNDSALATAQNTTVNPFLDSDSPLNAMAASSYKQSELKHLEMKITGPSGIWVGAEAVTGGANNTHNSKEKQHQEEAPEKTLDPKTLKRLAQNREAAKKSRLRKKEHMQQLESCKIKLAQLEQDLSIAQSQGIFSHGTGPGGNLSSGASKFDMEYARWLDNGHKRMSELRGALQRQLLDSDLRVIVDEWHTHYDEIFPLKSVVAKSDVFHLITGVWTNPAERFFLWMGGFRPSEMLKILIPYLDPLTEQQLGDICNLQQSSQQTEEMLSKRLDQLYQSLATTVVGESLSYKGFDRDYMDLMSVAVEKLTDIEQFVIQADMLRQQMLHQMRRILTIRQAARCFLAIGEYHSRLRTVSTLWSSRPRESNMIVPAEDTYFLSH